MRNTQFSKIDTLLRAFTILSAFNLVSIIGNFEWLNYVTKPLLISSLAIWYYSNSRNVRKKLYSKAFLTGLWFSVLGDILLMFVKLNGETFFLLGLCSFLIAHVCYILSFIKYPALEVGQLVKKPIGLAPFLLVFILSLIFLWDDLGIFKIPVVIYSFVIISMSAFCFNLQNRMPRHISKILFLGALLFVLSDFTIAITKFIYVDFSPIVSGIIIMTTYLMGQYMLVIGMKNAAE